MDSADGVSAFRDEGKRNAATLLTLRRGLQLLEAIALGNGNATAKSLSCRLGLKRGTCYFLLRTLEEERYVVRHTGGNFSLGGRIAILQDSLRAELEPLPQVMDMLVQRHERVGETVYASGWYEGDVVLQRYIEGSRAVHVRSLEMDYREYPHARASGKAIMAFLPMSELRCCFAKRGLEPRTANTIIDMEALLDHLKGVARCGVAFDMEEYSEDVCGVAAPFFDRRAFPTGSYVVSPPAMRFEPRRAELVSEVRKAAVETSRYLGYSGLYPPPSPPILEGDARDGRANRSSRRGKDRATQRKGT
jgi:IclR family transcriptional regulator, acetate operon repressor